MADITDPNQAAQADQTAAAATAPQAREARGGGRFALGFGRRSRRGLGAQAADAARLFWNDQPRHNEQRSDPNGGRYSYMQDAAPVDPTMKKPNMWIGKDGQTYYGLGTPDMRDPNWGGAPPAPAAPAPAAQSLPGTPGDPGMANDRSFTANGAATANIPAETAGAGLGTPPQSRDIGTDQTATQGALEGKSLIKPQIGARQFTGGNLDSTVGTTLKPNVAFDNSPGSLNDAGPNVQSVAPPVGGSTLGGQRKNQVMVSDVTAKEDIVPVPAADIDGFLRAIAKRQ